MKNLSRIMNIIYLILFIPLTIFSKFIYTMKDYGTSGANMFYVVFASYPAMALPLIVVAILAVSIALRREDKYKISVLIQFIPIILFLLIEICVALA